MTPSTNESATGAGASRFDANLYAPDSFERSQSALRTILGAHFHSNRKAWNIVALIPGYQEGPRIAAVVAGSRRYLPVVIVDDLAEDRPERLDDWALPSTPLS